VARVIVHAPVETGDLNLGQLEELKQKVYQIIQQDLDQSYPPQKTQPHE